jgi:FK506-binding protein 4/5
VKYEARLEDGTIVSKSEGVEFTVKEGESCLLSILTWPSDNVDLYQLFANEYYLLPGYFCPALARAVKTMKKAEKVLLTVKPQCGFLYLKEFKPLIFVTPHFLRRMTILRIFLFCENRWFW